VVKPAFPPVPQPQPGPAADGAVFVGLVFGALPHQCRDAHSSPLSLVVAAGNSVSTGRHSYPVEPGRGPFRRGSVAPVPGWAGTVRSRSDPRSDGAGPDRNPLSTMSSRWVSMIDMVDTVMIPLGSDPRGNDMPAPIPKYEQFAETIRQQIRTGELAPGERLPSTAQWAQQGWKHGTIVAGMRLLRSEGWVRGQPGEATFVADHPPIGGSDG
jgi:GntR family transcriptional regulator